MMKNILMIEAHPDDIILSLGGTIQKLIDQDCNIIWVTMTDCGLDRNIEQRNVIQEFKNIVYFNLSHQDGSVRNDGQTIKFFDNIIERYNIDTVFTHWKYSSHQDHKTVYDLSMIASRKDVRNVYMYEAMCPSHVNYPSFVPQKFFDITFYQSKKIELLKRYETQVQKYGIDWLKAIEALARVRGYGVGVLFAEAVQVIKECE